MKTTLIILFFLYQNITFSQVRSPYFLYDEKAIDLSERNFKLYIVPQLRAMEKEYFLVLKKYNPVHEFTVKVFTHLINMQRTFADFRKECSQIQGPCLLKLKGLYLQTRNLDQLILDLQSKNIDLSKVTSSGELDSLLKLLSQVREIGIENYQLTHAIETYLLTANTSFFPYYDGKTLIEPTIHRMLIKAELIHTQVLTPSLKEDFHAVWMHFFKEIDNQVLYNKDSNFLLKRLEELNLAWNTFHMKMTKGNHDLDKQILSIIKIMHNRWNSCLKIILR